MHLRIIKRITKVEVVLILLVMFLKWKMGKVRQILCSWQDLIKLEAFYNSP